MVSTTNIYYTRESNKTSLPKTIGGKSFHYHESRKGCCEVLKNTGDIVLDFVIKIEYSQLPSMDIISKFTSFKTKKEYANWWVEYINSLGTYKLETVENHKDYLAVYCDKKFYSKLNSNQAEAARMLSTLTILRYIWTPGGHELPLITNKLLNSLEIDPVYAMWLAHVAILSNGRLDYGQIYNGQAIATRSKAQHQAFFWDKNNTNVVTSAGNNKSYASNILTVLKPIYEAMNKHYRANNPEDLVQAANKVIDFVDNKLGMIGKNVKVTLSCLSNFTREKDYSIRTLDFKSLKTKPSVELMDDDFKLSKVPLTFCKLSN